MSNLTKFGSANLPTVQNLAASLRNMQSEVGPTGVVIIKMDKTGHWVYGADQTEIEDGSKWAVNPFSFIHGFIAWGDGEVLGEKMVPISEPLPELEAAPGGSKRGWEMQVGLSLKCISGEDKDLEARYTTTSVGGKRAVQALGAAIAEKIEANPAEPVAVVTLDKEHYSHKSYGRIYTPVFEIVDWMGMGAEEATAALEDQSDDEELPMIENPEPVRRRRAASV